MVNNLAQKINKKIINLNLGLILIIIVLIVPLAVGSFGI